MVARQPAWPSVPIVVALNLAFLVLGLWLQRTRMGTIGAAPTSAIEVVAKSNITFLVLLGGAAVGSFAALVRNRQVPSALLVATATTLLSYVLFALIAGQLWGS